MQKVLFVCNYKPGVGGISGQVEALHSHLKEEGIFADIFSTRGNAFQRLLKPFQLYHIAQKYDILHIHCCSGWGFLPAVIGISVGRCLKKRLVLTYHGGDAENFFHKHHRIVKHYLSRTNSNIVLSGFLAKVFDKYDLPYTIIPNVIELDTSHYRERKHLLPKYICTRSHEDIYDIPCILRAFQRVQVQFPEASLTLVGDGTLHDTLIRQVKEMELKNVTFTGRVSNKEIYNYLDNADVFISASTVDNMPVSLLEAMNAGLLVIASDIGGVPYLIVNGKTGLLFQAGNDNALVNCMEQLITHPEKGLSMAKEANSNLSIYSWEIVKKKLIPLYEQG